MTSRTPTSATSTQAKASFALPAGQKTSSSPDALTKSQQNLTSETTTDNTIIPFPSPQVFDVLPPLHALLLRLIASQESTNQQQQPTTSGPEVSSTPVVPPTSNNNNRDTLAPPQPPNNNQQQTTTPNALPTSLKPDLDTKSLLTESSSVKIRIQKAKTALEGLPDIDRTVREQEEEIRELEKRIGGLKGVVGEFGRRSAGVGGKDGGNDGARDVGEDVEMEMGFS
ncbi:hypothetical protein FQN54_009353 [Arachnomyces sp. PD_36]|nr:hypothetical protein FQN54_009353 [Arachnomyces sp. PD_36]